MLLIKKLFSRKKIKKSNSKASKAQNTDPDRELSQIMQNSFLQTKQLDAISKHNSNISTQLEEIHSIVKAADENARELKTAARRERMLMESIIATNDLLDAVLQLLSENASNHIRAIAASRTEILNNCGLTKTTIIGQMLDSKLHTVTAADSSDAPVESIIRILEDGYEYRGNIVRKAAVIISKGRD